MEEMHPLLEQQLKQALGGDRQVPPEWHSLLRLVNATYDKFDAKRGKLERSLEMNSEELFQANSEIKAICEAMPDSLLWLDYAGKIIDYKDDAGNALGLLARHGKVIGRNIGELLPQNVAKQFASAVGKVKKSRKAQQTEYSLTKNKSVHYFEARFMPLKKDRVIVLMRDITEGKIAEKALRESEEKYRGVFENALDGIFQVTMDGGIIDANPSLAAMLGYETPDEMMRSLPRNVFSRSVIPEYIDRFKELMEKYKKVHEFETKIYKKDGSIIDVSINAHVVENNEGRALYYEGAMADITDRKKAEEALFEWEEKYRCIVEESHVGIYIIQNNRFTFVNTTFCEIHGYTYQEVVGGMGPMDFIVPEDQLLMEKSLRRRTTGEARTEETAYRIRRKDGEIRTVRVVGNHILYKGQPAIIGTLLDITKEKELELQLIQSQKMETVGRLAGGIAHDFNNMLGVILGNAQLARIHLNEGHKAFDCCSAVEKAAKRAADFTKQLLAFSRRQVLELKVVDLNGLVTNFEKMIYRIMGETIRMEIARANKLPSVKADESQINQVLLNLVVNARESMPQGGTLSIDTELVYITKEKARLNPDAQPGRYVVLSVKDTGMGMNKETARKIFEPFYTTKSGGSGLGLSVVYGIVKQHGGFIKVRSEQGKGTTFKIHLPSSENVNEEVQEEKITMEGGRETILFVEDDEEFRKVGGEVLKRLGYTVYMAQGGEEGIDVLRKKGEAIDLVILDVVMPKMDGRTTLNEMRRIRPALPALFVTGYDLCGDVHSEGFDTLQKPYSFDALSQKIREIIGRSG